MLVFTVINTVCRIYSYFQSLLQYVVYTRIYSNYYNISYILVFTVINEFK